MDRNATARQTDDSSRAPESITAFAPATVSNIGPGFDVLGLAVAAPGDRVTVSRADGVGVGVGVTIAAIDGDGGRLPTRAADNTAGIAATAVLARAHGPIGVTLTLHKGMRIGTGLGSSAASAAAAAFATNALLGHPLTTTELIACCVEAEARVSGRHADNVAPALLGGLVLVRSLDPLDVASVPLPAGLTMVVATPDFELATRAAREALPRSVPLTERTRNAADIAAFIHACHTGDLALLGRSIADPIVVPVRAALIPGAEAVISAARAAGALAASISGAGPSIFALCTAPTLAATVADAMCAAFCEHGGLAATAVISSLPQPGARIVP